MFFGRPNYLPWRTARAFASQDLLLSAAPSPCVSRAGNRRSCYTSVMTAQRSLAHLGRYECRQSLDGGMSGVYLADDTGLKRQVVLKARKEEAWSEPEQRERFRRGAELAYGCHHYSVVRTFDAETGEPVSKGNTVGEIGAWILNEAQELTPLRVCGVPNDPLNRPRTFGEVRARRDARISQCTPVGTAPQPVQHSLGSRRWLPLYLLCGARWAPSRRPAPPPREPEKMAARQSSAAMAGQTGADVKQQASGTGRSQWKAGRNWRKRPAGRIRLCRGSKQIYASRDLQVPFLNGGCRCRVTAHGANWPV